MGPVWVTGSAGRLGLAVTRHLVSAGVAVRGFDRVPTPGIQESVVGNLLEPSLLRTCAVGARALIHLAATPDDDPRPGFFAESLVPNNILGLHNVLEAAREAKIPRLVLASSGQVNWTQHQTGPLPVRATDPVTPRDWYAATKMFMESMGYSFATRYGMSVIVVRLGWCPRRGQAAEIAASQRAQDVFLSPDDAGRFFLRCVEADVPPGYHLLYATSRPKGDLVYELEPARKLLGWEPRDQWPTGAEEGLPE